MERSENTAALRGFLRQALVLKRMPRSGWLQRGVEPVESVAEHSFGVAALALAFGAGLPQLDLGRLLGIAVLHDLAEALIGDLPASARRLIGRDVKIEAERRALLEICAGLGGGGSLIELYDAYVQGSSCEARLVKALDRLELLGQALEYERAGNRALDEFWEAAHTGWSDEFPAVRELALQLLQERAALNERYTSK